MRLQDRVLLGVQQKKDCIMPYSTLFLPCTPCHSPQEKARLQRCALLGMQQLAARGRLTRLAANSISGFVTRALEDAEAEAYPADGACKPVVLVVGGWLWVK